LTAQRPVRVIHFVTGGHVGATGVAISIALGGLRSGRVTSMLALSSKRRTGPTQIAELAEMGLPARVVADWSHAATVVDLARICRDFGPDVLVAHGFSEHLWGRYGGLLAKVPVLVHVEHNTRERYTRWRLAQARWLAKRTAAIVGCSEGVRRVLLDLGMPEDRCFAIPNGIRLDPFEDAETRYPFAGRTPGIVMCARFSKQKDHDTLIRAIGLLRDRGLRPPVVLAGGGKPHHRRPAERLVKALGLEDQIQMPGLHRDVPGLLMSHRIAVLSTHYEGMPLALVEGMAAGCAVVGSAVPGVQEMLRDGETGRLVPHRDANALADALAELLADDEAAMRMAAAARARALREHSLELMNQRYEDLFLRLVGRQPLLS
jgi:glycosyltransferase involved in cell wall biosynthesis